MPDLAGTLCFFGVAIVLVTLIGHGIWLMCAELARAVSGKKQPLPAGRPCTNCRAIVALADARCPQCGWPMAIPQAVPLGRDSTDASDQESVEALLMRLRADLNRANQIGTLDSQSHASLLAAVNVELQALQEQASQRIESAIPTSVTPPLETYAVDQEVAETTPAETTPKQAVELPATVDDPSTTETYELSPVIPSDDAPFARQETQPSASEPTVHPLDEEIPDAEIIEEPPAKPRRTWTELLSTFMEERHLRWGELVGGLMIVCGSIALVLSFWGEIAQRPFLKFFVFNSVTAGLFGLGFYADRRMKLPSTGQAVLMIGCLLTPLNFLAFAAFPQDVAASDWMTVAGEIISIVIFTLLVRGAAKTVAASNRWNFTLGVLIPSTAALIVRHFVAVDTVDWILLSLSLVPLCAYVGTALFLVWRRSAEKEIDESIAHEFFRFLGITTFATLLPLGLLVYGSGDITSALQLFSPLAPFAALPALSIGLLIWQRTCGEKLALLRAVGSGIGAAGLGILLAGIAMAWPQPALLISVSVATAIVLSLLGRFGHLPAAHVVAACCLAVAGILAFHVARGTLPWQDVEVHEMFSALFRGETGWALASVAGGMVVLGYIWRFLKQRSAANAYLAVGVWCALLSLIVVTAYGWGREGDPLAATWFLAAGALIAFLSATKSPAWLNLAIRAESANVGGLTRFTFSHYNCAWIAVVLCWAALTQAFIFAWVDNPLLAPWLTVMLTNASLLLLALCGLRFLRKSDGEALPADMRAGSDVTGIVFRNAAMISLVAAAALFLANLAAISNLALAGYACWIAGGLLIFALSKDSPAAFAAFQFTATIAIVFVTGAFVESQSWSTKLSNFWLDPWTLQCLAIALSVWGTAWLLIAIIAKRNAPSATSEQSPSRLLRYLRPQWPGFDVVLRVAVLFLMVGLSIYAALPGAAQELTPRRLAAWLEAGPAGMDLSQRIVASAEHFEILRLPHAHAGGFTAWLVLLCATLPFLIAQWERRRASNLIAVLFGLSAICPLIAINFESSVAVASAWRWTSAGFFLLTAAAVWFRVPLAKLGTRLGWQAHTTEAHSRSLLTSVVLALAITPLAAMLAFIGFAATSQHTLDPAVKASGPYLFLALVVGMLVALITHMSAVNKDKPSASGWQGIVSKVAALLGVAPLLATGLYIVSNALKGNPIAGPESGTFFHDVGLAVSYAVPLLVAALTITGFAIREKSPRFAFAAGLLFDVCATAGYLLVAAKSGLQLDEALWVRLAQLNAIVGSTFAISWCVALRIGQRWHHTVTQTASADAQIPSVHSANPWRRHALLLTTSLLATLLFLLPCLKGLIHLFLQPGDLQSHANLAGLWGWGTLSVVALACWVVTATTGLLGKSLRMAAILGTAALLAVFQLSEFDNGNWLSYHALLGFACAGGWLVVIADFWSERSAPSGARRISGTTGGVATFAVAMAVILALRESWAYQHPWWSVVALSMSYVLLNILAFARQRRWPLYAGVPVLLLAVSISWIHLQTATGWQLSETFELLHWNCIAAALAALISVVLERRLQKQSLEGETPAAIGCHRVITSIGVGLFIVLAAYGLLANLGGGPAPANPIVQWGAFAAMALACVACLWDEKSRGALPQLYVMGLIAGVMTLSAFQISPRMMMWTGTVVLAAYAILTSYLWSRRRELAQFGERLGIPRSGRGEFVDLSWLVPVTAALSLCVLAATAAIVLTFPENSLRTLAGQAAILQSLAFAFLARAERRTQLQLTTLATAVAGCVLFGWAWLNPPAGQPLLNHWIVVTVVLGGLTALFGGGLAKFFPRASEWTQAALRIAPALAVLSIVCLLGTLALEASAYFSGGEVPISPLGIAAVITSLLALIAAALTAALVPGREPLGLTERQRTAYVYACEGLLALVALHIRLTMPWLFHGFFQQFWPYIVVAIAFVGLGLAEVLKRQKRLVLAEPLSNTGVALPLLPILGFWLAPAGHYSLILIMAGALYGVVSIHRRSFAFGMMSTLAANGALWYYLSGVQGLGFWEHPQLWLIPVSLCAMVAAQLNRHQLDSSQITAVRYLSSITLYVSSSAEIFMHGVANAPWSPLVLAGLAVLGVLTGMLLRVRAFLFLGTSFLFVALSSMIWHATVNLHHTWLLWLTVVTAGVAILALFAVFEKKRNEVLRMIDSIRKWAP